MPSSTIYHEVVGITYEYLGPAADRFVTRQIRNHLHKNPEQLQPKDLQQLLDWMRLAMGLLSDDKQLVELYIRELEQLSRRQSKRKTT